jgi:hypothetical protein
MSTAQEIRAAIALADEEMADSLRRLSDFLTNGDVESAKVVAAQAGATHAKLVRLHNEAGEFGHAGAPAGESEFEDDAAAGEEGPS